MKAGRVLRVFGIDVSAGHANDAVVAVLGPETHGVLRVLFDRRIELMKSFVIRGPEQITVDQVDITGPVGGSLIARRGHRKFRTGGDLISTDSRADYASKNPNRCAVCKLIGLVAAQC